MFQFQLGDQFFVIRLADIKAVNTITKTTSGTFAIEIHWRNNDIDAIYHFSQKQTRDDVFLKLLTALENSIH